MSSDGTNLLIEHRRDPSRWDRPLSFPQGFPLENVTTVAFDVLIRPPAKTKELIKKVKPYRHFILAASDFPETSTPYENIEAFSKAGKDFGAY